ncbi:hypothetical protein L9F63_005152 [Diploptera punctata]|uniref:Uncharacterized protein n=1 Tax=Diploptera punctata TaxID=6984 RepID=A0AAD7ZE68_DIPPU|nr:hypothetical protein L9F63_005152 [Diploptera punctata]
MLLYIVLVWVLHFQSLVTASSYFPADMTSCPSLKSMKKVDINQMMGEWKLILLFMEEGFEEYEDESSCVHANFKKVNETAFKQMWYINSLQFGNGAIAELPTSVTDSADWIVQDPFGGELIVKGNTRLSEITYDFDILCYEEQ